MNLPNKLTVLRVIMVPFFVFFMLTDVGGAANKWIALAIFVIASLTDMLDGKIARKYNLVTNFGKFMDPLADKLLVCSAMICLIPSGKLPTAIVIVIIAREFIISGFRLVASDNGIVIAANYWGKFKTVSQMAMIIVLIADLGGVFDLIGQILIWLALALTIISLIDYVWTNRQVLTQGGMYLEWYLKEQAAGEKTLEETVVELLAEKGFHITTAESCTGGMIAGTLVNVAGASEVLNEGYVTYSNEAKERLVRVSHQTLEQFGAVSEQTAREMAEGAARAAKAEAALSATGIAGPGGGTAEKPVGLVYIGCYLNGKTTVKECRFTGNRMENRLHTVETALEMLKERLLTEE